jgi:hypothetical protein
MNNIVVFKEAQEEAGHLSKVTGRSVEVVPRDCDCDRPQLCMKCDRGTRYEFIYSFCSHPVNEDGEDSEICFENYCREQERVRAELAMEASRSVTQSPLLSCEEVASQTSEAA